MALPPAVPLSTGEPLRAATFSELQRGLRQGLQTHLHGEDAPLVPAEALPADARLSARALHVGTLEIAGRPLAEHLPDPAAALDVSGSLEVRGDLQIDGRLSEPPQTPRTLEARCVSYAMTLSASQIDNHRWMGIPPLALALELSRHSVLLVECAAQGESWTSGVGYAARAMLQLEPDGARIALSQLAKIAQSTSRAQLSALIAQSGLASSDMSSGAYHLEHANFLLFDGGGSSFTVALRLPPGPYLLHVEALTHHGGYVGPGLRNTWLDNGIRWTGYLTVHIL